MAIERSGDGGSPEESDWREGIRFLWREPLMRTLTLLGFGVSLTSGAVLGLLVVFTVRNLGVPDDDARIGLVYAAGAVGALIASIALPRITRRFSPAQVALAGMTAGWLLVAGFAFTRELALAALVYLAFEIALVVVILNGITYRQRVTTDHLQGRVNVFGRMIAWGGQPVGAALGGVLATVADVRTALLVMSAGMGISAIVGWAGPLRRAPG